MTQIKFKESYRGYVICYIACMQGYEVHGFDRMFDTPDAAKAAVNAIITRSLDDGKISRLFDPL